MIPTHNSIRDIDLVMSMAECHELLTSNPISVMVTEDDKEWIRDGHHRAAAIWLVYGYIPNKYVKYETLSYEKINSVNISAGWVTPFNPETTCRLSDFRYYKDTIKFIVKNHGEHHAESFIKLYSFLYSEPRVVTSIEELITK